MNTKLNELGKERILILIAFINRKKKEDRNKPREFTRSTKFILIDERNELGNLSFKAKKIINLIKNILFKVNQSIALFRSKLDIDESTSAVCSLYAVQFPANWCQLSPQLVLDKFAPSICGSPSRSSKVVWLPESRTVGPSIVFLLYHVSCPS